MQPTVAQALGGGAGSGESDIRRWMLENDWVEAIVALPTDLFPGKEVGMASGFSGMGGAVGGVLANLGTGWIVQHFSYAPVFLMAGLMHPLSAGLVYWLLPNRYFFKKV